MEAGERQALRAAVELIHGCSAVFRTAEVVREGLRGHFAWQYEVATFDLPEHPTASLSYAWCEPVAGERKLRYHAVLHQGPVKSPVDALRTSLLQEPREVRIPSRRRTARAAKAHTW